MRNLFLLVALFGCRDHGSAMKRPDPARPPLQNVVGSDAVSTVRDDRPPELVEISKILTVGPTIDDRKRQHPNYKINDDWDGKRVWLTEYRQHGVEIELRFSSVGTEDVTEFLKRLAMSRFFDDVVIQTEERARDPESGVTVMQGRLTMRSHDADPNAAPISIKPH